MRFGQILGCTEAISQLSNPIIHLTNQPGEQNCSDLLCCYGMICFKQKKHSGDYQKSNVSCLNIELRLILLNIQEVRKFDVVFCCRSGMTQTVVNGRGKLSYVQLSLFKDGCFIILMKPKCCNFMVGFETCVCATNSNTAGVS